MNWRWRIRFPSFQRDYDVTRRSLDKASDVESDEGEWVEVSDERFPEEGVTVTLPYPKGTSGRMQDFVVCHMFAENMYLSSPGEVEYPEVTETAEGIQFKVYGLSPIAVGWTDTQKVQQPQTIDNDSTEDADSQKQNDQDTRGDQDRSSKIPAVLGSSGELGYLIFVAVILAMISIILLIRLRKKKD